MKNNVHVFLEELVQHYSDQENIQYIYYDGSRAPEVVEYDPLFTMESNISFEYMKQWLADYIASKTTISYYELFKAIIKETAGLWVNPTMEELKVYNCQHKINSDELLEGYKSLEAKRREDAVKNLSSALDKEGYSVYLGKDLINRLINLYDLYNKKDQAFIEWADPIDISLIENEVYYIVDREVFILPIKVTKKLLNEYENRKLNVSTANLPLYFEHVLVTKQGMDSQETIKDKQMSVYFYQEVTDYLQDNAYESLHTAYQKLAKNNVDPSLPFIEIIVDDFTELYSNTDKLKTEDDLLSFINQAYRIEGVDREAKSLYRKRILQKLLTVSSERDSSTELDLSEPRNN